MALAKRFSSIAATLLLCLQLWGCGGGSGTSSTPDNAPDQQVVQAYVDQILNIMQNNAVNRNEIDWGFLRSEVNALAANASTIRQTYPAITRALVLLGTNHSFLSSPNGEIITYPSTLNCQQDVLLDQPNVEEIGYIRVDGFSGTSVQARELAANIQAEIALQDGPSVVSWVVDLRNNTGGNMWPMIAGLGPLFDSRVLGHFIDANEGISQWGYENGSSFLDENNIVTVNEPYSLINPMPKIAVLSSKRVGSSGEATLIAFKQQFNVRFFGTDSCGLSTANQSFELRNGDILVLTTSITADRNQIKYGNEVQVDEPTDPQDTLNTAVEWLLQ